MVSKGKRHSVIGSVGKKERNDEGERETKRETDMETFSFYLLRI